MIFSNRRNLCDKRSNRSWKTIRNSSLYTTRNVTRNIKIKRFKTVSGSFSIQILKVSVNQSSHAVAETLKNVMDICSFPNKLELREIIPIFKKSDKANTGQKVWCQLFLNCLKDSLSNRLQMLWSH